MENESKREFQRSLDIIDEELEKYIPQLLQGLWELGGIPGYVIELVERNIGNGFSTITDFGCGKGAVLIQLAQKFDFKGLGIDIVPEFIDSAIAYAEQRGVADKVRFSCEDFVQTIKSIKDQDLVIYGYDSEILGDLKTAIDRLAECIRKDGYILVEFMFANESSKETTNVLTEKEMIDSIRKSRCRLIDRINWDKDLFREVNRRNNIQIEQNVKSLISRHPGKIALFESYYQNQLDECIQLERDFTCSTLLLQRKRS